MADQEKQAEEEQLAAIRKRAAEDRRRRDRERLNNIRQADQERQQGERTAYLPILGALFIGLTVGYFLGREHVKYELRSAVQTATERLRKDLAPIIGTDPQRPVSSKDNVLEDLPPPKEIFSIESINSRVTEKNDSWWRYAWILELRNKTGTPLAFNATIEFQDSDGFAIDQDHEFGIVVPANSSREFTGFDLIRVPGAMRVDQTVVKVHALR